MNERTLQQMNQAIESVLAGASKVEYGSEECTFIVYQCGTVIRMDIKMKKEADK